MNSSFLNRLPASFQLFLDNELTYFCSGFQATSGQLYYTTDPRYSEFNIYGSPFSQWVADNSVVQPPSGVYDNGVFIPRGVSGLSIDFLRGRILTTGVLANPTINYSIKELNVYYTDAPLDDPNFLIDNAFSLTPQIIQGTGALNWNQQVYPCIYFNTDFQENSAAALGNLNNTLNIINCYVIAESTYQLDAAVGALCDTNKKYFSLFKISQLPYTILGDIKNGEYNYFNLSSDSAEQIFISNVIVEKFEEIKNKKLSKSVWGAHIKFDCIYQFNNV